MSRRCAGAQRSFRDRYTCFLWCLGGARARSALSDIVARRAAGGAEALGSQAGALTTPRLAPVQSAEFRLVEAGLGKIKQKNLQNQTRYIGTSSQFTTVFGDGGSGCFWATRIRIRWSGVRIRIQTLSFFHIGVERTEIMLAK